MGVLRLIWKRENCRFFEGCRECINACPKKVLEFEEDKLNYCRHCNSKYAACKTVCPNNALLENKQGVLVISRSRCDGCGKCAEACSSKAISLVDGKAVKCDLCAGREEPACVRACPHGALMLDEGERGSLIELPAVEFGSTSLKEDAIRIRVPPTTKPENVFQPTFVGDGKKIPTVKSWSGTQNEEGKKAYSEFSFRNLALPMKAKVDILEVRGKTKIFRLNDNLTVYYYDLPVFSKEEWDLAKQAKYFTIREAVNDSFPESDAAGYFDVNERKIALERVARKAERILGELDALLNETRRRELAWLIAVDTIGFGPIELLWNGGNSELEEIEINHPYKEIVVYHRKYGRCITNLTLTGERGFRRIINAVLYPLGCSLDEAHPCVDAQLPDGSRLHAQLYPLALSGGSANIRFAANEPWTIPKLIEKGALSEEMAAFLWLAIEARKHSIVLTGPPAAGKTSFLSALLAFLPKGERVISIEEDLNELRFYDSFMDWIPLKGVREEKKAEAMKKTFGIGATRSVMDQVINALRMRPERIILGELRGAEAQRLFAGANLGIPFATTMHSNEKGISVIKRLHSPPMSVPTESLSQLDLVITMNFDAEKKRRVMELSELCWNSRGHSQDLLGCETNKTKINASGLVWRHAEEEAFVNPLYEFSHIKKCYVWGARRPSRIIEEISQLFGADKCEIEEELKRRAAFIKALTDSGKTSFIDFGKSVQEYVTKNKDERAELIERITKGEAV